MVTGVETAGLVLAALPLVISALQHYNEGLKPLKDFARYKSVINELSNDISLQKCLLRGTCEKLLTGLVDSESHLACLLDGPTSPAWREEQLALRLQERLQDSYSNYCELVSTISLAFGKLHYKIGLNAQGETLERAVSTPQLLSNNIGACATYSGGRPMFQDTSTASSIAPTFQKILALSLERFKFKERKSVSFAAALPGIQMTSMQSSGPDMNAGSAEMPQDQLPGDERNSILSLCSTLLSSKDMPIKTCLGRLEAEEHHYEVITLGQKQQGSNDFLTLHEIIERNHGTSIMPENQMLGVRDSTRLTRKARLELAIILASTALQLQTTPWLDTKWSGKCIRFANGSLQHPFISRAYPGETAAAEAPEAIGSPVRNRSIFGLGVLLLELAVGKPIDCFKNPEQSIPSEDFLIASQLLHQLEDNEGAGYLDAAQACIFCNFGSKAKILDFGNDSFRQAVYEDVIVPLEDDLKFYCRGTP
ncbi:MAG: hypothetical protein LQ352_003858 [Teloschistes flavicans]|nr:MAG: hypothetical protein LQ352_003858 [Teloschistes flavicans]